MRFGETESPATGGASQTQRAASNTMELGATPLIEVSSPKARLATYLAVWFLFAR
jgi:hypothetical protein